MLAVTVIFTAIFSWSCHLEDFNLSKLAKANDIKPEVFAPLAYGTYTVGDHLTTPLLDTDTIKANETDLDLMIQDKTGVSLSSSAVDSAYLVVTYTNSTPMRMNVSFDFINLATGAVISKKYDSGLIESGNTDATGKVTQPVTTRIEFGMDSIDMKDITTADGIEYTVKLFLPAGGTVIVKNLKESQFKLQISLRAIVTLGKL